ncbi:MAG TPA: PQQ-dependent sugar dehydrogenase [Candidatus Binatia bacterium]|nr:PQQ-dependent sugar dehydrogenase [Candidatus Binatia bacterium]
MKADSAEKRAGRAARAGAFPVFLVSTVLLLGLAAATDALAITLPAGFEDTEHVGGLEEPVAFEWAPNGDLWIVLKRGGVRIVRAGQVIDAGTITVRTDDELGIGGLALDPEFATNHHVWIYYSDPSGEVRVSRFTVVGDALSVETIMLRYNFVSTLHHAGCLRFDADKTLYISTGDDFRYSATSQNPFDLRGKILRINRDGTPAAGNPFLGGGADPRVWALGLRNPWRFSFQPGTGTMFIADVGQAEWEELNFGMPGANYGWSLIEGFSVTGLPGYVYPVYTYRHESHTGNSIIGGDHAKPGDLAPEYEGNYFYGDEADLAIGRLVLDASNNVVQAETWATGVEHPVDLHFGPDGALYYAAFFLGSIRKITFVGGTNHSPKAAGTATPVSGPAPLPVFLDGTASSDLDGDPLTFLWDTGNGAPGQGPTLTHIYDAGVYTARLTVTDPSDASNTTPGIRIVSGNRAPAATIIAPAANSLYNAGDTITYAGLGTDPEDGTLGCGRFTWTITFHHLGHVHPHLGPIQGMCGGSFTVPRTGENSAATYYEIRLDLADLGTPLGEAGTLTSVATVKVSPRTVTMNLAASPNPNLFLTLDGTLFAAPKAVTGVVGFDRDIGATSQTGSDGRTYTFSSWSDGGAATHTIRTPESDTTYTAQFACHVIAEVPNLMISSAGGGLVTLTWDSVSDLCLATGPARYRVYAATTASPQASPGQFPADPPFALVGSASANLFTYAPGAETIFYLVVAVGSDGQDGPAGHYPTTVSGSGLVGQWKLDDGSGTSAADASGGNTGTLVNGPTWTAGHLDGALAFDGLDDEVNVPHAPALNAYPLTVAAWFKTGMTTGLAGIVNKYPASSFNGYQIFVLNGNLCAWYMKDGSNYVWDGSGCTFNVAGYNDNQWHHVAFVVDASGGKLFVDGLEKGNLAWTGTAGEATTTEPLRIGRYPGGGAQYFSGVVDDVRVYNRALTALDVANLWSNGSPPGPGSRSTGRRAGLSRSQAAFASWLTRATTTPNSSMPMTS